MASNLNMEWLNWAVDGLLAEIEYENNRNPDDPELQASSVDISKDVPIVDMSKYGVLPGPSTSYSTESGSGTSQEPSFNCETSRESSFDSGNPQERSFDSESSQNYSVNKVAQGEKFPDFKYFENLEKLEAEVEKTHCTFLEAQSYAVAKKKWLLVNILNVNDESSQLLNRDIWSKPDIRKKINKYFIFWQVDVDSAEGKKYCKKYNPVEWPYVSVIDPRNGKCVFVWNKIEVSSFHDRLMVFLKFNSYEEKPDSKEEILTKYQMQLRVLFALVKQLQERIGRLEVTSEMIIQKVRELERSSGYI